MKMDKNQPEKALTRREIQAERASRSQSFNRGQTISSYGSTPKKSERTKNRELVIRRRKFGSFFGALVVVSVLIMIFLSQFVMNVHIIDQNKKPISSENSKKYTEIINDYYNSQPIERLRSNLNKKNLLAALQKSFPEIDGITEISLKGLLSYNFQLKMRKPVASWVAGGKTLFVDSKGVIFENNYFEKPALAITDENPAAAKAGLTVASNSFISFVGKIVSIAEQNGLKVEKITSGRLKISLKKL